jgi:FtsP/CotA-like multicopper oxidase with cupredoxin domain
MTELVEPDILSCTQPIVLHVKPVRWTIPGQISLTSRKYCHEIEKVLTCGPIGPTILISPGFKCNITIVNALEGVACSRSPDAKVNGVHCANTTNLHLHGLFVSPQEDDVMLSIEPGNSYTYSFNFHESLLMGTHWYHAHHHGSSNLQVQGGLFGALLTSPASSYSLPADLAALYASARTLVLSNVFFNGTFPHEAPYPSGYDVWDYSMLHQAYARDDPEYSANLLDPAPDFLNGNNRTDIYLVNGQFHPFVSIPANTPTLLRLVHASAVKMLELQLSNADGWPLPTCEITLLARDGVFQSVPYLSLDRIVLPAGGRADVVLFCSDPSEVPSNHLGHVSAPTIVVSASPNPAWDAKLGTWMRHWQSEVFSLRLVNGSGWDVNTRNPDFSRGWGLHEEDSEARRYNQINFTERNEREPRSQSTLIIRIIISIS